jgi:hypothetical protein
MTWGMVAVAGATVVGGVMGSQAAGDAADAQAGAAAQSDATQRYIYDQSRADQQPFLQNGYAANNKLAKLLGLGSSTPSLLSTGGGAPGYNAELYNSNPLYRQAWDSLAAEHYGAYGSGYTSGSDRNWIEQGIRSRMGSDGIAALTPAQDASFGSLLKQPTRADIEADPTYAMGMQFGLDEGTKGINRQAAATGGLLSGATLKALTKYGNDYGTQKAGDAVNRINAGKQQQYSMLSGMSGGGQAAAGQTQAAGSQYASAVGQAAVGLGNARAASAIGQSNAWTGAINGGIGAYQNNQLMQTLRGSNGSNGGTGYGGPIDPWNGNYYQQPGYGV